MTNKIKDVELTPDPTSLKKWKLKHDGYTGTNPSNYPKIDLKKDDGPHLIVFKIKDGPGITFSKDPIWVQEGTTPPSVKTESDQIPTWRVRDAGKKLVVFDWNDNPQLTDLAYRLNFDGYAPLDPIIRNGGGEGSPPPPGPEMHFSGAEIAMAGLALLVAFLVGFYVHRKFFA